MRAGPAIAILGIGCRFPGGADSPARYWDLLAGGHDATTEAPPDRLDAHALYDPDPGRPGKVYVRRGGYLPAIDAFDAAFFGISPREARRIDPQQRLLLEVAWEALEDAGVPPSTLAGTRTGVFVGISGHDYGDLQARPENRSLIDVHVTSGTATSIAANRISYALDLRGPSLAVDTACSSALTAVHLACRSLLAGECELAIAGAANALLTAEPTIGFCKAGMLAPDGRCKPFDAAADGYGRGEGAGAVVLKALERAQADGDAIHAVILATAVNQDGRTPALSVPSPDAQEALLRDALRAAGLRPDDVAVVEAHGTGTPVGDPREALALGRALGDRTRRLVIGSAKGNLGHLEAAAGIAGLIKAALMVERRAIPPTVNFTRPNPAIDFEGLRLRVPATLEPWPDGPAIAGVNAFGFGGANAHAIVAEAHGAGGDAAPGRRAQIFTLSARDPRALRALASRCAGWLRDGEVMLGDACHTAALRRDHHEHRLAIAAATRAQLADALDAHAAGEPHGAAVAGRATGSPRVAFVFSGMGPQWWGMGRELLASEPAFAETIDACDGALRPLAGWSLRAELERAQDASRVTEPYVAHVANLALQLGLAALWRSWGIVPDAVVGHSSGEMGAACAAGALSLPDAVALAYHRGRLQHRTAGSGGMLAAGIAPGEADAVLRGRERAVSLAAVNGPRSLTLSGDVEQLGEIAAELERRGVFRRMLDVTVPYHGPQMDALRDELLDVLADLRPQPPAVPFVSTVTGDWRNGAPLDAAYWWSNVRRPVLFAAAIERLATAGCELFVELSPHPVLAPAVADCLGDRGTVVPSLRRGEDERATLLRALGALHVRGRDVDWRRAVAGGRCVRMPTYPWQRERHWIPAAPATEHPLLGRRAAGPRPAWEAALGDARLAFLDGHRVQGTVVFPAAGHVELALAAARALAGGDGPLALEDVTFERLLGLPNRAALRIGCVADAGALQIHSAEGDAWTQRARARIADAPDAAGDAPVSDAGDSAHEIAGDALYATLADRHELQYDGAFRSVVSLSGGDGAARAELALPDGTDTRGWHVHPALLDGAFQALGATAFVAGDGTLLPVGVARVELYEPPRSRCLAHVETTGPLTGDVTLTSADGRVLVRCTSVRLHRLGGGGHEDWLYEERWEPAPRPAQRPALAEIARVTGAILEADGELAAYYDDVEAALDALALTHIRAALDDLDVRDVAPRHRRLHAHLAAAAAGAATPTATAAALAAAAAGAETPTATAAALAARQPAYASAIELVEASGRRLAATLRGDEDAREWLVAGPSLRALTELYAACRPFAAYGDAVAEAVAAAAPARVLEVGAGTGGATGPILARLAEPIVDYAFSDVSPFFLRRARERFADRRELRTLVVDVEDPPDDLGGFDVVVAADVVHATTEPSRTLANLRRLLAPGGVLVLMEGVRRSVWLDVVFGQLEGWWRAGREHPFRPAGEWLALLEEAGYAEAAAITDAEEPAHAVLLARAPALRRDAGHVLVLTDADTGPEVAAALRERGERCTLVWPGDAYARWGTDGFELDPADPAEWAELLDATGVPSAIVDLWALDAPPAASGGAALMAFQRTSCGGIVAICQALAGLPLPPTWIVTAGALAVQPDEDPSLAQAPAWGAGRVLRSEQGAERCRLVDIGTRRGAADVAALVEEICAVDGDGELAFRDGVRLRRRFLPAAPPPARPPATAPASPDTASFAAAVAQPGALESLCLRSVEARAPGPGEVAIRVVASALNFRDVLVALGIGFAASGEDLTRVPLGWECAGVVEARGEGVDGLAPGDDVVAIAAGGLGSRVVTLAERVVRKPAQLSFEEAVTLPVAFLTAVWALERRAAVRAGERVLVHCASGGVGLAAIQVARRAGAEVLATAGSEAKRAYLRGIGIEHVFDSRSLDFADGVRTATAGEGVDIVLNSLTGDAVDASLALLRPYGRFVEIGKRDIYEDGSLGIAPFRNNLSYIALDLHPLYADEPATVGAMLREIVAAVERGELATLAQRAFDLAELEAAFRHMAQARHIGKVVVTLRGERYDVVPATLLCSDGAYVISGGLGGFGLRVAQWMVGEGAGHIVLCGRRGLPRDEDMPALEELLASGADVHFVRADITSERTVARLLEYVRASVAPLRGVVHAAMALDDGLLGTIDYERFETALAPKLAGAWNLHRLSAEDELDMFVMFSSVSLLIGQVAQSGYAAGNAFLGALAAHRRAHGLPALTVDWGAIADAGYVARQPGLDERLRRQGLAGIPADEACAVLGDLLRRDVTRIAVSRADWSTRERRTEASEDLSAPARSARSGGGAAPSGGAARAGVRARLAAAARDERAAIVEEYLLAAAAVVLETAPERVDADRPLGAMGVDSLMAVELRTAVRADLGVEVPIVDLLERLSLRGLAATILERLDG